MPRDSLRALVDRGDRERALPSRLEPERLVLPPRPPARIRQICLDCRRDPYETAHAAFMQRYIAASSAEDRRALKWPLPLPADACPTCGGRLVEITV